MSYQYIVHRMCSKCCHVFFTLDDALHRDEIPQQQPEPYLLTDNFHALTPAYTPYPNPTLNPEDSPPREKKEAHP